MRQKLILFLFVLLPISGWGQISMTDETTLTQNFSGLGTSATATLPTHWKVSAPGAGTTSKYATLGNFTTTVQQASSGAPTTGSRYNWGNGGDTNDRALGFMTSGSYASPNAIMVFYENNTGSVITEFEIAFDIERYRINTATFSLAVFYSTDSTASWTSATSGDINTSAFATGTSSYTFTGGTVVNRSFSITGLTIPDGGDFFIKWVFTNTGGTNSQGLGLDNFSITPVLLADEPTVSASGVNFTSVGENSLTVNWTNGDGDNRLVLVKSGSAVNSDPVDQTTYSASTVFGSGSQIGTGNYVVYNGSGNSVTVTGLTHSTTYHIAIYENNGVSSGVNYKVSSPALGNQVTDTPADPTIDISGSLTSYGNLIDGQVSSPQSYSVSATSLTANLVITPPVGFEISLTENSGYLTTPSTLELVPSSGIVSLTTIYVRFSPNNATPFSGNITHTSTDAITQNQPVSGNGIEEEPTSTTYDVAFISVTTTSFTITWANGDGSSRLVLLKAGSAVDGSPTDGVGYTANSVYGTGDIIGTGNYVIYNGNGTSVSVTGLAPSTTHYISIFEFNGTGTSTNYLTPGYTGQQQTEIETYTWNGGTTAFSTASNWTPTRTYPGAYDILLINGAETASPTISVTSATNSAGQLRIINNASVSLSATTAATLSLQGGIGLDFEIENGSKLVVSGANAIQLNLLTGLSATISDTLRFTGGAHRLQSLSENSVQFTSTGVFVGGTGFTGNAFGAGTGSSSLNSVVFQSGAKYRFIAGGNPFGAGAPSSVVIFQDGSLFHVLANAAISISGRTYANIEIDHPSYNQSFTGAGLATVNNFTVTQGTINLNLTGGVQVKGTIHIASGTTLTFTPATSGVITFNGTASQSISGAGTLTASANSLWVLDNSNGLTLNRNLSLAGKLTLTTGILNTNGNTLTISNAAPDGVSNGMARTNGWLTGSLIRAVNTTDGTRIFPIGTVSHFRGISVTHTGVTTPQSLTAQVVDATPNNNGLPLVDGAYSINTIGQEGSWSLTSTGATGGSYSMSIRADGIGAISNVSELRILRRDTTPDNWVAEGTHVSGTGTPYQPVANRSGLSNYGQFAIGGNNTDNPLPVGILSSSVRFESGKILMEWETNYEINHAGFKVFRYSNHEPLGLQIGDFSLLDHLKAKGLTGGWYSFQDENISHSMSYSYELVDVSLDGTETRHQKLLITTPEELPLSFGIISIYPNPFNPSTMITYQLSVSGRAQISVYDVLGREVERLLNEEKPAGNYQVRFDASRLNSGVYFVRIVSGNQLSTAKVVLMK